MQRLTIMKKIFASFGWIVLLLPLLSFAGTKTFLSSVNSTIVNSENRQVSGFNAISAGGSFDVFVKFGPSESLVIEGDEDQASKIETKVENGVLKIHYKSGFRFNTNFNKKVTIYITAKSLKSLSVSGSGDMKVSGVIKTSTLETRVSGSGSISFSANVSSLSATVSGSGDINASGSATTASIRVSGSGEFKGKDLHTSDSDIKVSGSGEVRIYAEKSLNAAVSGSGDIFYSGNPAVKQVKSGSGKITRI